MHARQDCEDAVVRNKAAYLALGVQPDGSRDILENTEGATFRTKVFNDLKTRGVNDILIAASDDFKGVPEVGEKLEGQWIGKKTLDFWGTP